MDVMDVMGQTKQQTPGPTMSWDDYVAEDPSTGIDLCRCNNIETTNQLYIIGLYKFKFTWLLF